MKKYNIIVMYPGMNSLRYTITGNFLGSDFGSRAYVFELENKKRMYFPVNLTIIEEQ